MDFKGNEEKRQTEQKTQATTKFVLDSINASGE